jgi:dolichyl-phosphooligosaccharide-protein glycotransferase
VAAVLGGLAALAFGVRALDFAQVFVGDRVIPPVGDAYYHLRRALFTMQHFPRVLTFDPLVGFPQGARIPWPPLHDFALAAAGRLAGATAPGLERVAAWAAPWLGALTVIPVFAAGALIGGRALGLGAAAIFAMLPASIAYSGVGDADHHVTVALFGASWLSAALLASRAGPAAKGRLAAQLLSVTARAGVLLTWPGSLLYLAVADGTQIALEGLRGRPDALFAEAAGLVATALGVVPVVAALGPPAGGPFSAVALSWLQPAALLALAAVAAGTAALERVRPRHRPALRALGLFALALPAAAALLALPGVLGGVAEALAFLGKAEPWAARNAEQLPLLGTGATGWLGPLHQYGGFGYLIPLVPLIALVRAARTRAAPCVVLAAWSSAFGALAVAQLRYGSDFAPAASVGFALLLAEASRALRARLPGWAAATALGALVALTAGPLVAIQALRFADARTHAAGPPPADPLLESPAGSLVRFAEEIRALTPDASGFDDPSIAPAYGVLAPPNLGHVLHYVAHRATPADNFGPYAGARAFATVRSLYFVPVSEARVVAIAERLRSPYLVTMEFGASPRDGLIRRLHLEDGLARGDLPRWERFRLIAEGPHGGRPLLALFGRRATPGAPPYKLFELVEGAVLEAHGVPGTPVEAQVTVRSPSGRRFVYSARGQTDESGIARLRVPYATLTRMPVRPTGPYRLRIGARDFEVAVSEDAVRRGDTVAVGGDGS